MKNVTNHTGSTSQRQNSNFWFYFTEELLEQTTAFIFCFQWEFSVQVKIHLISLKWGPINSGPYLWSPTPQIQHPVEFKGADKGHCIAHISQWWANYDLFSLCRDGNVSLQEYMAFMISRETENVKSSEEIESAFRALSTENKPYVTKEELYQVRCVYLLTECCCDVKVQMEA